MTNPVYGDIEYDMGTSRNVKDGSTAIQSFITKAKTVVKNITGTTTGTKRDIAIRNLAAAYTAQAQLGGLGPESAERVPMEAMRDRFIDDAKESLRLIGYSLDGVTIQFSQVNP